jgi:hypothetical protein
MRAPVDTIPAPPFPAHLKWLNVPRVRMDKLRGRPLLVEFWDFCRSYSLNTLPYMKAWHARYGPPPPSSAAASEAAAAPTLCVIGIHSPGFERSRDRAAVEAAVKRLGIAYPVLLDPDLEMWQEYENKGWPARYLFDGNGMLYDYHYGEGAYDETELAIQELLEISRSSVGGAGGPSSSTSTAPPGQ